MTSANHIVFIHPINADVMETACFFRNVFLIANEQWAGFVERLTGAVAVESVSADPNLP